MHRVVAVLLVLGVVASAPGAIPPDEHMQLADGLYVRGLYDLALDEYLALSREAPDYARSDMVLYRIGECHRRLDNLQAAERFYLRVLREHPKSDIARRAEFRRAETFVTLGQYLDAINHFRAFLEKKDVPDSLLAPALYYKGYAAKRHLLLDEAERDLQAVLDQHADSPFASYAALDLADLYSEQPERASEALELYRRAAKNPATPDVGAEALSREADWHFRAADYEKSAELYTRLLKDYPTTTRARESKLQAAWALHNISRYADALALADKALADPDRAERKADWLYLAANCHRQQERPDAARAAYAQLLESFPDHALARVASYELALIAFREDQFDDAIEQAQKMEADETIREDLYWLLAESYAAVGRDDDAVRYYRLLLEADPKGEQAPKALYRLARLLQNRRDYVEAARTYRQLADQFPKDEYAPHGWFAAAFCMAMENRYPDAIKDWDALLKQYPDHELAEEARYQKALAELQQGRDRQARTALTDFLKRHEESRFAADAYVRLAALHEQDGKHADAEKALRSALDRDPAPDLGERARFQLAVALQRQEKWAEAATLLQDLLDTDARGNMPLSLLEWLALYQLDAGEYDHARAAAERLTEAANTPAWKQIGWALAGRALNGLGKADAAVAAFEKSLAEEARTRDGAEAALYLGMLKLELDKQDEAVRYLGRAAELASGDDMADIRARSYFGLGRAAEKDEDWSRAARYYLGVGILFDDPKVTPDALYRAAEALDRAGREKDRDRTREELKERYPGWEQH